MIQPHTQQKLRGALWVRGEGRAERGGPKPAAPERLVLILRMEVQKPVVVVGGGYINQKMGIYKPNDEDTGTK